MKRMMKTMAVLALALLAATACTRRVQVESEPNRPSYLQTAAPSTGIEVVGVYDYLVVAGADVITGPMTVTRASDGAYAVAFVMDDGRSVPTRNVRREGNSLMMDATTPAGEGTVTLTWVNANEVEGQVFIGETLDLEATRRQ